MILINIAALLVAIAVVLLVITLIPLVKELKATSVAIREFVVKIESDLQPAIKELNDTLADLNVITAGTAEKIDDVKCFMTAVGDTGRSIHKISTVVGGASDALSKSSLLFTGAKAAGSYMLDRLTKKRR